MTSISTTLILASFYWGIRFLLGEAWLTANPFAHFLLIVVCVLGTVLLAIVSLERHARRSLFHKPQIKGERHIESQATSRTGVSIPV